MDRGRYLGAKPLAIQNWSLTSLQQRLFKTGGRLIRRARYFILQLAESLLTPTLFRQILGRIERLAGRRRECHRGAGAARTRCVTYANGRQGGEDVTSPLVRLDRGRRWMIHLGNPG